MNYTEMDSIKVGKLITVTYANDTKKSGVITKVSPTEIEFASYDETIEQLTTIKVTQEQKTIGKVKEIVTLQNINVVKKDDYTSKASYVVTKEEVTKELSKYKVEDLIAYFIGEEKFYLTTIAALLNDKQKYEFLYKLVTEYEINIFNETTVLESDIDGLNENAKQLKKKLDQLVSTENNYKEDSRPELDPTKLMEEAMKKLTEAGFGGLFGGGSNNPFGGGTPFGGGSLFGGSNSLEDILKNLNPNDKNNADILKIIRDLFNGGGNGNDK